TIAGEEEAVACRGRAELARAAADGRIDQDRRLRRVPVVRIVRRRLVVPRHLAGIHVDSYERARVEVVPLATRARVARCWIAGAKDIELRLGIVDAGNPDLPAAVSRRVEVRPRVESGIARLHRHGIELPLHLARLGIERLEK